MALTDAVVRQARITGKDYTLNDADGLVLFVTGTSAKKRRFRFTWLGKQQRIAIGSYPELSLKEAVSNATTCARRRIVMRDARNAQLRQPVLLRQ